VLPDTSGIDRAHQLEYLVTTELAARQDFTEGVRVSAVREGASSSSYQKPSKVGNKQQMVPPTAALPRWQPPTLGRSAIKVAIKIRKDVQWDI